MATAAQKTPVETSEKDQSNEMISGMVKAISDAKRVLQPRRLDLRENVVNDWVVKVDSGVTAGDIETPKFWQHYTNVLRRGDELRIDCVDGSWTARGRVLAVGPREVMVKVLDVHELEVVSPDVLQVPSGYTIEWAGDIEMWRVRMDREVLKSGFESKGRAAAWSHTHAMSQQK
ncbi:MAG: hypothetical protein KDA32_14870 [Phycisphaerales bacterium]|nr:hypothetical protein [Phycisphaerales bacterium]